MYTPLILRFASGAYFFAFGYYGLSEEWKWKLFLFETISERPAKFFTYGISIVEIIGGMFLFMGFLVQPTVVVLAIISATAIVIKLYDPEIVKRDINIYILLTVILMALFILGPGYHAIDLPI